jgi:hypothetical protein
MKLGTLAAACLLLASAIPSAAAGTEEIPVPGGTVAMARALGIEPAPDRPRFLAELVRVVYDTREGRNSETDAKLALLASYVDAVGHLQKALATFPQTSTGLTLASAATSRERGALKDFLDALGLRVREKNKTLRVELADGKQAVDRARQLTGLGIDVATLAAQLNAGQSVRIQIPTDTVPVPLTAAIWSEAALRHSVTASTLFTAIVSDRRAALLAHGLAALDDETLRYLADHPAILSRLYDESAAAFAAFGEALRIRGGRVLPPGGTQGLPVWEAVLNEKAAAPDHFIRAVFEASQGRVALVYSALTHLDAPHVRFALGSWIPDVEARIPQFKALIAASTAREEWAVTLRPFSRPPHDVTQLLARVRVQLTGAPAPPAARLFWHRAFDGDEIPDDPANALRNLQEDGLINAGWLAENVCVTDPRLRADRLDRLSFGQRAFSAATDGQLPDALVALRSLVRFRMLMLTLDRMGVRDPRVFAMAAGQAKRLMALDGRRAFIALGQFQSALALTARLVRVRSLTAAAGEALVASLVAVPPADDGSYHGAIARWLDRSLAPALGWPASADVDAELVHSLAGVIESSATAAKVTWEGRTYRVDLVTPEQHRLARAREKMESPSVTAALELARAAAKLSAPALTLATVRSTATALRGLTAALPKFDKKSAVLPPAVEAPKNALDVLNRTLVDLSKITRDKDLNRAAGAAQTLFTLGDDLLAQALMSWTYAIDIGDPDGTTLMGGDPSRRHDFGLETRNADLRVHLTWAEPREMTAAGAPRHVEGSLLGFDAALSDRALRRIDADELPSPPTLTMPDRETFVKTVGIMNPFDFTDADRDALVAALARGRARLAAVTETEWDAAADQLRIDGWRRREGRWALTYAPETLPSFLSLFEILSLGDPPADLPLDRWGMASAAIDGCLCATRSVIAYLPILTGRPQFGLLAALVPDLNLRLADRLAALRLPASLLRGVLAAATQDYIDQVRPIHPNDWMTLVRTAQALTDDRIDDYIAALTADGPLVAERSTASADRRQR